MSVAVDIASVVIVGGIVARFAYALGQRNEARRAAVTVKLEHLLPVDQYPAVWELIERLPEWARRHPQLVAALMPVEGRMADEATAAEVVAWLRRWDAGHG